MARKRKEVIEKHPVAGALPSPADLRDYKIAKTISAEMLPDEFEVPHSKIKNQGMVNSCVAHSVSEVLEAYDQINYSTGWVYGYRPKEYYQGQGMYVSEALKTINNVGAVYNDDFDFNIEVPKAITLVNDNIDKLKVLADKNKSLSYARLHSTNEIKQAIYTNQIPVIMTIMTDTDGIELDKNFIAKPIKNQAGGHAVVCYGWNKDGFLIQNSWGTQWGKKGCFILPYEYGYYEAWLMTKDKNIVEKPYGYCIRSFLQKFINHLKMILH